MGLSGPVIIIARHLVNQKKSNNLKKIIRVINSLQTCQTQRKAEMQEWEMKKRQLFRFAQNFTLFSKLSMPIA